jgi:hypothetical protein
MMSGVLSWWYLLCAFAAANVLGWLVAALVLQRRRAALAPAAYAVRRLLLVLSAVYVAGCAFRSVLPVFDGPRICLLDSWVSSVAVGRSVATCAELCFVAQWAVMLHAASRATDSVVGKFTSLALVPLIAVAELCSWYSVLTTSNIGHVAEESIWGLAAALLVTSMLVIRPRCTAAFRPVLLAGCIIGAAYVAFMFLVDVPMYWARWVADGISGRHYLTIAQGIHDAAIRRVVSYRWSDWKSEVVWMSLYFSVAVWLSIAFVHAPMAEARSVSDERKRLEFRRRPATVESWN